MEESKIKDKKKPIGPSICVIILILMIAAIVLYLWLEKQKDKDRDYTEVTLSAGAANESLEKWQEGVITYKGKDYVFNDQLSIYYLMGIDKAGKAQKSEDYISGGQSDANFLLIANNKTKELSVFAINRNTMTQVETYGINGDELGSELRQINIQHAYGDGMKFSCTLSTQAVENLFYNIPIDGYMSIHMDAIPMINDAVGGVTLEVLEGASGLPVGQTVTLTGDQAYTYLRCRDVNTFDSATLRLNRQEQYITKFFELVKEKSGGGDISTAMSLYNNVSDYVVTNVDFEKLVNELIDYDFDASRLYTIPGETKVNEETKFEEFYVDEDAFRDIVMKVFYEEV